MGLAAINGSLGGCFAPTSLYGILTVDVAEFGGVDLNPWVQFAFVFIAITALQVLAQYIFGRSHAARRPRLATRSRRDPVPVRQARPP